MNARKARDQPSTLRKMSPSLPAMATAPAAMARFCGEIIFPSTPPDEFAAAMSSGLSPACLAAETWSAPKRLFDDVSEPVTATPSHPRIGDRMANRPPDAASQEPNVDVCPEAFMT